jgi:transcriptional regulator with XRE-family HTH domain
VYAITVWAARELRVARRSAGISQRVLAERAGVPQSTVGRIEAGLIDPRASTLRHLLRSCGMDLEVDRRLGEGVDRTQIRERLERDPRERLEDLTAAAAAIRRIRGRARRR